MISYLDDGHQHEEGHRKDERTDGEGAEGHEQCQQAEHDPDECANATLVCTPTTPKREGHYHDSHKGNE